MKICVISSTVFTCPPPGYAGLEQLAWQQAEGLAGLGHEVALVAPEGSRCDKATLIPTGPPGSWDERKAYSTYWQHLPGFDAIIDNSWQKWALNLRQEGVLKAPVLCVLHAPVNTMFSSPPEVEKPCFVCISNDQAAHFQALYSMEARVAHNGIDLDFYQSMGLPRSRRFLFLARFSTVKGPDIAINACKEVGVGLDLVGDTSITNEPEFLENCNRLIVGANLEANRKGRNPPEIKLVGPASRGECVSWFSQAHCLLHPNMRFREPFGLAPVEAMACGTPVIAWDNGAMRETVKHGETGYLVKSVDDFKKAVWHATRWDDHVLKGLRSQCRDQAAQFSIQKMVSRYEQLCQEAVATGGW